MRLHIGIFTRAMEAFCLLPWVICSPSRPSSLLRVECLRRTRLLTYAGKQDISLMCWLNSGCLDFIQMLVWAPCITQLCWRVLHRGR